MRCLPQLLARGLAHLGIDEAMRPLLVGRAWSLVAGPATMYFVARSLSAEEQGFNYTFSSLMALQVFLELGFSQSIIQFTAHEGASLTLSPDRILTGPDAQLARMGSLFRFFVRWYAALAVAFALGVGVGGYWFFAHGGQHGVRWLAPWCLLILGTALSIALQPCWHFLTGLNQVAFTNRISATNAIALNLVLWGVLLAGGRLLGNPMAILASFALVVARLVLPYRSLWRQLWRAPCPAQSRIHFQRDIVPFQWRITFTFLAGYFVFELFTPACFRLAGPAEAGRLGMTLTLLLMVVNVSQAFVSNKYPLFSMMVARGDRAGLRASFRHAYVRCVGVATVGLALSIPVLALLKRIALFSDRLLEPSLIALLALAALIQCAGLGLVYFVRAHRKEPFIAVAWAQAVVTPAAIYFLGRASGVAGIALAYLISWCVGAPWIFLIFRTFWTHHEPTIHDGATPDHCRSHL